MKSLIDVFKMDSISIESRIKIIKELGIAVNHQCASNVTDNLVAELVCALHDKKNKAPKIIQIQAMPNDAYYQGCYLGLADNGVTYMLGNGGMWEFHVGAELCGENKQ